MSSLTMLLTSVFRKSLFCRGMFHVSLLRRCRRLPGLGMFLLGAVYLSSGCSLLHVFKSSTAIKQIQVNAESGANQNTATALDIVFVYDDNAVALLPKTGPEWFEKKAALTLSMATAIAVVSLQIPPATLVNVPLPAGHSKAIGVYCFVNYLSVAGQAVSNLTPYKSVAIWLTPNNVIYKGG
jgi:type VI secretion system protein